MRVTILLLITLICGLCACVPITPAPMEPTMPTSPVRASTTATPVPPGAARTSVSTFTRTPTQTPQYAMTETYLFAPDTPTKTPPPTATPLPTAVAVLTGTFEITPALSTLYGAEGLTVDASGLAQFPATQDYALSTVKVLVAAPFTENHVDKYALVISQENAWGDCYSCPLPVRAAIFARQGQTWVAEWRGDSELGFAGHAPTGQLVQIGPDRYGFAFIDTQTSSGYALRDFELFAVMGGYLADILSVPNYTESMKEPSQPWAGWEYISDYQFVPGENADYYDLRVTTKGSKVDGGQVVPADASVLYTWQKDRGYRGAGYEAPSVAPAPPPAQALPALNPRFTIQQALQTLYQPYLGAQVSDQGVAYVPTEGISWTVNVVLAQPYEESGRHKLAVLTEWTGFERGDYEGCPTCGGGLGGGIFVQSGNTWRVETKNISNTVDYIGSWGHAPDGRLAKIGPDKYGFLFFPANDQQGYFGTSLRLYAERAGQIKLIASFDGFYERYGEFPGQAWPPLGHESVYQFKPGQNTGYYDLYIDTTGACNGDAPFQQATCGFRVYTFNGSEYVQASGPALPTPPNP
jgi:hypothetical protein